jgi:hypothetical protein
VVNFLMPVPPVSEQQEIAEQISATAAAIDALIDKATEVIDTLREHRSALITDAVTGRLRPAFGARHTDRPVRSQSATELTAGFAYHRSQRCDQ